MMVATSSLAVAIGLLAMIAGRAAETDIAPPMEPLRTEPQLVTREDRGSRLERFTPPADTKADLQLDETAIAGESTPQVPETALPLGLAAADEAGWETPLLGDAAVGWSPGNIDFAQP